MQCRYCLESTGEFIHPCKCKNPVHHECLGKWLGISNRLTCEVCNHPWSDDIVNNVEEAELYLTIVTMASFVIAFNLLVSLLSIKMVATFTLVCTLGACALNVCNIVVFMPFVIIHPYFASVSMLTCLLFVGQTALPLIEQHL